MYSWVVIRFHVGMSVTAGVAMTAGMANSQEETEREAEDARRHIVAADAGREVRDDP